MSDLFTELQQEQAKQKETLKDLDKSTSAQKDEQKDEQKSAQKGEQDIAQTFAQTSAHTAVGISGEKVEELSFRLRKTPMVKVSANIPEQWKERLDEIAHTQKVGKYELLLYVIASFLNEA